MEMQPLNRNYHWPSHQADHLALVHNFQSHHLHKPSLFPATLHPSPNEIAPTPLAETIGNYYFELLPRRPIGFYQRASNYKNIRIDFICNWNVKILMKLMMKVVRRKWKITCIPMTAYIKNNITINSATYGSAWNDLMNVHNSVRIPSPRLSNFTKRITRKSRKNNVIEIF